MNLDRSKLLAIILPARIVTTLEFRAGILEPLLPASSLQLLLAVMAVVLMAAATILAVVLFRRLKRFERQAQWHTEQLHALHEASLFLTAELSQEAVLQKVVDLSRRLTGARYGALGVLDETGQIQSLITSGLSPEERARIGSLPQGRGLLGAVIREGRPIRVADIQLDPRSVGFPPHHPPMTSFLGVPVIFKGQTLGNLYLADKACPERSRREDANEFTSEDEELLTMFATQAAVAIENARLYEQVRTFAVVTERERIAREMHDSLAQVLSYVSTKTQAVRELLQEGRVEAGQVQLQQLEQVAQEVYADVREAILGLRTTIGKGRGLFPALQEYLQSFTEQSGVQTQLVVTPQTSAFLFDSRAEIQLIRIIQEALTNVRKHAQAEQAWVRFAADGTWAIVTIEDDGRGFDPSHRRRGAWPCFGLQIMQERAEAVGGSLEIESRPGEGTRVTVRIPLQDI